MIHFLAQAQLYVHYMPIINQMLVLHFGSAYESVNLRFSVLHCGTGYCNVWRQSAICWTSGENTFILFVFTMNGNYFPLYILEMFTNELKNTSRIVFRNYFNHILCSQSSSSWSAFLIYCKQTLHRLLETSHVWHGKQLLIWFNESSRHHYITTSLPTQGRSRFSFSTTRSELLVLFVSRTTLVWARDI